jgi:DNA-binding MarR family transcriptional regulator
MQERHHAAVADVLRQLTAVAVVERRLARRLPHGPGSTVMILAALDRMGETRMSELADRLDSDLSGVSRQIAHLESRGLVARRVNPDDRRSCLITVTPEGRAELERSFRARTDLLARATEDWTAEELAALTGLLGRLRTGLSRCAQDAGEPLVCGTPPAPRAQSREPSGEPADERSGGPARERSEEASREPRAAREAVPTGAA